MVALSEPTRCPTTLRPEYEDEDVRRLREQVAIRYRLLGYRVVVAAVLVLALGVALGFALCLALIVR